jgi:hypothetical protein
VHDNWYKNSKENRLIAIFYEADYISGKIELSDEHTRYTWVEPQSILNKPKKFMSQDEYNNYKNYISN